MTASSPYYSHDGITIYHGDCWEVLPELPPVSLVIASGLNAWPCRELPADANTLRIELMTKGRERKLGFGVLSRKESGPVGSPQRFRFSEAFDDRVGQAVVW